MREVQAVECILCFSECGNPIPQDGTNVHDVLREVAVQADGSILLAGATDGDWSGANAGDNNGDWAVVSLSTTGEENWRWQVTCIRKKS